MYICVTDEIKTNEHNKTIAKEPLYTYNPNLKRFDYISAESYGEFEPSRVSNAAILARSLC